MKMQINLLTRVKNHLHFDILKISLLTTYDKDQSPKTI